MCSLKTYFPSHNSRTISASAKPRSVFTAETFAAASAKRSFSKKPAMASISSGLGCPVVAYTSSASIAPAPFFDKKVD